MTDEVLKYIKFVCVLIFFVLIRVEIYFGFSR